MNKAVDWREDSESNDTPKENEGRDAKADDETNRKERDGEVSTRVQSSAEEFNCSFDGVVHSGHDFDHKAVQGADSKGIQDGDHAVASFFTCNQHFPARHAFWVRQGFFDDEQSTQSDGEHGAKPSSQQGNGERDAPIDVRPKADHEEGWDGENHASGEAFTRAGHGLHAVVFQNADVVEHQSEDDHRHDSRRNAGRDRHPCIQAKVRVCGGHQNAEHDTNTEHTHGEFWDGHVRRDEGVLRGAHATPNPPFIVKASAWNRTTIFIGWTFRGLLTWVFLTRWNGGTASLGMPSKRIML